ncbi:MAG: AAA family ATPase [Polyangiaceae bacterium]
MAVDPGQPTPSSVPAEVFDAISRSPLYIPGFFGVVTKELLAVDARLEELLSSGHHNEVLRNMLLRLRSNAPRIERLREILKEEFKILSLDVPFSEKDSEFLKAAYSESRTRITLDLVSAGSGFLQVLQILVHALQNPSAILLLDEPDAHMHCALQRSFLALLRKFAAAEDLQVIMASHSETFLRETSLESIRVIDSQNSSAMQFPNAAELQQALSEAGIWPDHVELAEIFRTRRVILLEGKEDEVHLDKLGRRIADDWDSRRKLVQAVLTDGSSDSIITRLEYAQRILGNILHGGLRIAHFRDRDLLSDDAVERLTRDATAKGLGLYISDRRNREAYLAEPAVVERAVLQGAPQKVPEHLRDPGAISAIVHGVIMDWCNEILDELPDKVRQYNQAWMKKLPASEAKDTTRALDAFIRKEWQTAVASNVIPWKFVDGKAVLPRVRTHFQPFGIQLPEPLLHSVMTADDYGPTMRSVVELLLSWVA